MTLYEEREQGGKTRQRLQPALNSEPWDRTVHAFEHVIVLSAVLAHWPQEVER